VFTGSGDEGQKRFEMGNRMQRGGRGTDVKVFVQGGEEKEELAMIFNSGLLMSDLH
jgi:hypothetical protein